jgi:hypothetical protein
MVNLLPQKNIRALRRTYYIRLITVCSFFLSGVVALGALLLAPSYFVSERTADASEQYLSALEETIGVRERAGAEDEIRALRESVTILNTFADDARLAPFFGDLFGEQLRGVRITSIALTREEKEVRATLGGIAETRNALIAFGDNLRAAGYAEGVEIPLYQLAQDSDIPFSINFLYRSDAL